MFHLSVRKFLPCVTLAVLVCTAPQIAHAQTKYRIIKLLPKGARWSEVIALNKQGDVIVSADDHFFIFHDGKMKSLGVVGDKNDAFKGMNNKGDMVGSSPSGKTVIASLFRAGKRIPLGEKSTEPSRANAINDKGDMVGSVGEWPLKTHATLFRNGKMQDLGTLGGQFSNAYAINNQGDIVGASAYNRSNGEHAFLYRNGKMIDLSLPTDILSRAFGINDRGGVVGEVIRPKIGKRAFLYRNGKMQILDTLHGLYCAANAINNNGDIVGSAFSGEKHARTLLYKQGKPIDLNSLLPAHSGWILASALGINDKGMIIGNGGYNGGECAFLMQPIMSAGKKAESKGK